jgi:hypothetical protein
VGFLLHDDGACSDNISMRYVTHFEFVQFASPKLAVNGEIKQGKISGAIG